MNNHLQPRLQLQLLQPADLMPFDLTLTRLMSLLSSVLTPVTTTIPYVERDHLQLE